MEKSEKYIDGEKWVRVYISTGKLEDLRFDKGEFRFHNKETHKFEIVEIERTSYIAPIYEEVWEKESDIRRKLHLAP